MKDPFQEYTLLLHTSFSESFGMVFCEAIYSGIPVLAFNVGGAKEIIGTQNGQLVEAYNTKDMYHRLIQILESPVKSNPETVNHYNWDSAATEYLKIFRDVA